ncbi:MAG: response regulator transcription factor [Chloroflexi bacterium]|nr:response regulator transcription factor [Chloroflexota bacterium]
MEPIRVLIVDDHPMIRRGLRNFLSSAPDINVVGEAEDSATALRAAAELAPDVILLDIQLTGADGVAVASQLRKEQPNSKVIILTAYDNDDYIQGALRAGANAYLLKKSSGETVVDTIRQVHQGKRLLSPELMDRVLQQFQDLAQIKAKYESGLGEDEVKVLALMAQGATVEEIAQAMFWGERTVRRKIDEIIVKLGVKNRTQAVAEAIKKGLI